MPDAGTTLRKITKLDIIDKLAAFEIISIGANKELQLQNDLIDMTEKWKSTEYPTTTHKDTNIQILANLDDIQVNSKIIIPCNACRLILLFGRFFWRITL